MKEELFIPRNGLPASRDPAHLFFSAMLCVVPGWSWIELLNRVPSDAESENTRSTLGRGHSQDSFTPGFGRGLLPRVARPCAIATMLRGALHIAVIVSFLWLPLNRRHNIVLVYPLEDIGLISGARPCRDDSHAPARLRVGGGRGGIYGAVRHQGRLGSSRGRGPRLNAEEGQHEGRSARRGCAQGREGGTGGEGWAVSGDSLCTCVPWRFSACGGSRNFSYARTHF